MDFGELENEQFAEYINNQNQVVGNILRSTIRGQQNQQQQQREYQQEQQQNIDWTIVLAAKDLLEDNSIYRLPIAFTLISFIRIMLILIVLGQTKERTPFIQIFTSVGLFRDLLQMLYNYMIFRNIQHIKKLLFSRCFNQTLMHFLEELQEKNVLTIHKSSFMISCVLNTNSFLRSFQRFLKVISWGQLLYVIYIYGLSERRQEIQGICLPLIVLFTLSNFCLLIFVLFYSFFNVMNHMTIQFRDAFLMGYQKYLKYKLSKQIENLPTVRYENMKDKENNTSCAVCLVDYNSNDYVLQLACSTQHHFHKACIKQWLNIKQNCPICRSTVFLQSQSQSCQDYNQRQSSHIQNQSLGQNNISDQNQSSSPQMNSPNQNQIIHPALDLEIQNAFNLREKSHSHSSTSSQDGGSQKINQQFFNDLKNRLPNRQIVEMIEENLRHTEIIYAEQQLQKQQQQQLKQQQEQEQQQNQQLQSPQQSTQQLSETDITSKTELNNI